MLHAQVRAVQAQVEERLASHVKRQLSELVGSCIERALKDASQKRMQGKEACLPEVRLLSWQGHTCF